MMHIQTSEAALTRGRQRTNPRYSQTSALPQPGVRSPRRLAQFSTLTWARLAFRDHSAKTDAQKQIRRTVGNMLSRSVNPPTSVKRTTKPGKIRPSLR
ncbi:hypothetical protein J1614_004163 [Plenodomus biglobosus]|nr:hypothetical protein J1614_004163 [Plenodomus biglobosus]